MLGDFLRFLVALGMGVTCFLFVRAALHKISEQGRFQGVLADYGLLPEAALRPASTLLPVAEIIVALLLVVPSTRPAGAVLAAGLLSVYALAMTTNLLRGNRLVDCGCGDEAEPLSWKLVLRNAVLIGVTGAGALGYGTLHDAAEGFVIWPLALLLAAFWFMAEKAFANQHRMQTTLTPASSLQTEMS